ncbi:hypothetical protein BGZ63DRAFT_406795 [Mariannaea sp. PMI_226]|nr:hypothetical protein BGZ63DRAFT_406795 [Mariannaea sp. PMI_226]
MVKGEKKKKDRKGKSSNQESQIEPTQLWQINEVTVNDNYTQYTTDDGEIYYNLVTARSDLPESFWYQDWLAALQDREQAEHQAESSGNQAQQARRVVRGQLLSQQIANDPNADLLNSSAEAAKKARKAVKPDGLLTEVNNNGVALANQIMNQIIVKDKLAASDAGAAPEPTKHAGSYRTRLFFPNLTLRFGCLCTHNLLPSSFSLRDMLLLHCACSSLVVQTVASPELILRFRSLQTDG